MSGVKKNEDIERARSLQKQANAGTIISDNIFDKPKNSSKENLSSKGGNVSQVASANYIKLDDLLVDCHNTQVKGVVITPEQLKQLLGDNKLVEVDLSNAGPLTFTGLCIAHLLSVGFDIQASGKELANQLELEYSRRNQYSSSADSVKNFFNSL